MATEWYFGHNGEQRGPVSGAELKRLAVSAGLSPTDLVWKEGMDKWALASRLKGFFPTVKPANHPPNPEAPDEVEAWYYAHDDQCLGPVCESELRQLVASGSIRAADLVWQDGTADWVPAQSVKGLLVNAVPVVVPSPPPVSASVCQPTPIESLTYTDPFEVQLAGWQGWGRNQWGLLGLLLLVILSILVVAMWYIRTMNESMKNLGMHKTPDKVSSE